MSTSSTNIPLASRRVGDLERRRHQSTNPRTHQPGQGPAPHILSSRPRRVFLCCVGAFRARLAPDAVAQRVQDSLYGPRHVLLDRLNADDAAVRSVVLELHAPGDLGEDGVVLAEPGIQAGTEPAAALAHDDRA